MNGRRDLSRQICGEASAIAAEMGTEVGAEEIENRKEMMGLGTEETDIGMREERDLRRAECEQLGREQCDVQEVE